MKIDRTDIEKYFERIPVDLDTFLYDEEYLNLSFLSPLQKEAVALSSQIYYPETIKTLGMKEERNVVEAVLEWGKGCLASSERLQDAVSGEIKTVKDWAREGFINVNSYNTSNNVLEIKPAKIFARGLDDDVYKVGLNDGREIICTAEHPILIRNSYARKFGWREKKKSNPYVDLSFKSVKDLKIGEYVAVALNYPVISPCDKISIEEARLLGYLIGDGYSGSYSNSKVVAFLASKQSPVAEDFMRCLRAIGDEPVIWKHRCNELVIITSKHVTKSNLFKLWNSVGLFCMKAYDKFIPDVILESSLYVICNFLEALYATDGWVSNKKCKSGRLGLEIGYCSVSKDLVLKLQSLLHRIGVHGRIYKKRTSSDFGVAYSVVISNPQSIVNFNACVRIVGKSLKQRDLEGRSLDNSLTFVRVRSIDYVGKDIVFDLSVKDNHNYVSSGFISHNSGKDFCSMVIMCRVCYLLDCLVCPQEYYGKHSVSYIDMINMAYSADQAASNFFQPFRDMMKDAPCFDGRVESTRTYMELPAKKIRAFSGNSFGGGVEGKNLILGVLDEIAEFKTAQEIAMTGRKSMRMPKYSAEGLYDVIRTSVDSRFPGLGKVILISYPRFKGDFIEMMYDKNKDDAKCFTSKAASWDVNPTIDEKAFDREKIRNPERWKAKYKCEPSGAVDSFFRRQDKVERCFPIISDELSPTTNEDHPIIRNDFKCTHDYMCSLHIDLAAKWDRAGMCLTHQSDMFRGKIFDESSQEVVSTELPVITIDLLTSFQSKPGEELDFEMIRRFIYSIRAHGFRIGILSLDGFESVDMRQHLSKAGYNVVYRSVDRGTKAYDDLKGLIYDNRLVGGYCLKRKVMVGGVVTEQTIIIDELLMLVDINGRRIDHIAGGSKDEADSLAGSVQGSIELGMWKVGSQDISRSERDPINSIVTPVPQKRFVILNEIDRINTKMPPNMGYKGDPK